MAGGLTSVTRHCEDDCREIHNGWGQWNLLAQKLARRSFQERKQIRESYLVMYGEDLAGRLHQAYIANQTNEVCAVLNMWMLNPHERDAIIVRTVLENIDAEYRALVEIYTCRKSNQLFLTKQAYQARFNRSLDHDIISESSHPYQKILAAIAASHRSHKTEICQDIAKCDAKRLYDVVKGAPGGGIDEATILEMLSKRSIPQLRLTLDSYKHIYGHSYSKSLKKDSSGDFKESLQIIVKCVHNPSTYYAKMLYMSMKGMIKDKNAVSRIIVSRAEVDMEEIKREFHKRFGIKLHDAISESIQNEDCRDFLVSLTTMPSSCHKL